MLFPKPKKMRKKSESVTKIKLQDEKRCYKCNATQNLEKHHILYGSGRRKLSEKYGLVVYLCPKHHRGNASDDEGVHFDPAFDHFLKRWAQFHFEKVYSRQLFVKLFGRNYL